MPESSHHFPSTHDEVPGSARLLTYAVGDIHGSLPKLQRLVAQCENHAGGRPATFVFLGDYIDRGQDSAGVVRFIMELQARLAGRVIALKGNHEAMLIAAADGATPEEFWLEQGGAQTLASYGVARARDLPHQHLDWVRALPRHYDDRRRFFVHAGVDPRRPLTAQDENDLIWIRQPFLSDDRNYGRLIVHGHTPLAGDAPDLRDNRLNLDTGAVFGGPLTAAVFSDVAVRPVAFLQAE